MRKFKLFITILLSLSLCLGVAVLGSSVIASNGKKWFQSKGKIDTYVFPITPNGTPDKWKELQTYQEMLDACQIPEKELKTMTTEGLIETCLSYPMMGNMMLSNSTYEGFNKQIGEFNGLEELLNRENLGPAICKMYYNVSLDDLDEMSETDKYYSFRLRYLEYIISQPEVIDKINHGQKQKLLNYSIEIAKIKLEKYSDTLSVMPTALMIGRILMDNDDFKTFAEENDEVKLFLETGTNFTSESFEKILEKNDTLKKIVNK